MNDPHRGVKREEVTTAGGYQMLLLFLELILLYDSMRKITHNDDVFEFLFIYTRISPLFPTTQQRQRRRWRIAVVVMSPSPHFLLIVLVVSIAADGFRAEYHSTRRRTSLLMMDTTTNMMEVDIDKWVCIIVDLLYSFWNRDSVVFWSSLFSFFYYIFPQPDTGQQQTSTIVQYKDAAFNVGYLLCILLLQSEYFANWRHKTIIRDRSSLHL